MKHNGETADALGNYESKKIELEDPDTSDKFNRPQRHLFKLIAADEKGFRVSREGETYHTPFEKFVWNYSKTESWKVVAPELFGKSYIGRVEQIVKSGVYITSRKTHLLNPIPLVPNTKYKAIICMINTTDIFGDVGVHFDWVYGSMLVRLSQHKNFNDEDRNKLAVGKTIEVVYQSKNTVISRIANNNFYTKYYINEEKRKSKLLDYNDLWQLNENKYIVGEQYEMEVYKVIDTRAYGFMNDGIKCRINFRNCRESILESSLCQGDIVMVRVEKKLCSSQMLDAVAMSKSTKKTKN